MTPSSPIPSSPDSSELESRQTPGFTEASEALDEILTRFKTTAPTLEEAMQLFEGRCALRQNLPGKAQ